MEFDKNLLTKLIDFGKWYKCSDKSEHYIVKILKEKDFNHLFQFFSVRAKDKYIRKTCNCYSCIEEYKKFKPCSSKEIKQVFKIKKNIG